MVEVVVVVVEVVMVGEVVVEGGDGSDSSR